MHDFVPFGSTLFIYDVANDVDTKSYAAYFHADYKFNDSFGITVGARYSKDDKKFEGGQADLDGYSYKSSGCWARDRSRHGVLGGVCGAVIGLAPFPDPNNPYRYFPPGEQSQKYDVFTPTVGAQFHIERRHDAVRELLRRASRRAAGPRVSRCRSLTSTRRLSVPRRARPTNWASSPQFFDHRVQANARGLLHRLHRHPAADPGRRFAGVAERG